MSFKWKRDVDESSAWWLENFYLLSYLPLYFCQTLIRIMGRCIGNGQIQENDEKPYEDLVPAFRNRKKLNFVATKILN